MKKVIPCFLIILLLSSMVTAQQNWFLPGATFTDGINWFAHYGYVDYVVAGDTVYDGVNCKHLLITQVQATQQSSIIDTSYGHAYAYELSGYVFGTNNGFSKLAFDTIYNFNAVPGDTWGLYYNCCSSDTAYVQVIDTSHIVLNGYTLKKQLIAYHGILEDGMIDTFIERIGSTKWGFHLSAPCGTDPKYSFCSYEDSEVGYYGWFDCDSITVGIEPQPAQVVTALFPNPATDLVEISGLNNEGLQIEILNTAGVNVRRLELENNVVDVSNLSPGLYLLNLYRNEYRIASQKLCIQ